MRTTREAGSDGGRPLIGEKIRKVVQQQWAGLIALFLVLSGGTAWATHETILSSDIVNGEVRNADLGANAVTRDKVLDETLRASDIAPESLGGGRIADNTLTGIDVANAASGSDDVNADKLDGFNSTDLRPIGRSAFLGESASCFDENETGVDCVSRTITLPRSGRVLLIGAAQARAFNLDDFFGTGSDSDATGLVAGHCHLRADGTDVGPAPTAQLLDLNGQAGLAATAVTGSLAAGSHTFTLFCHQDDGDIGFDDASISAVTLGNG